MLTNIFLRWQPLRATPPHQTCGQRLLTASVDGLRHQEDLHDVDRAAGEITSVVGVILQHADQPQRHLHGRVCWIGIGNVDRGEEPCCVLCK